MVVAHSATAVGGALAVVAAVAPEMATWSSFLTGVPGCDCSRNVPVISTEKKEHGPENDSPR